MTLAWLGCRWSLQVVEAGRDRWTVVVQEGQYPQRQQLPGGGVDDARVDDDQQTSAAGDVGRAERDRVRTIAPCRHVERSAGVAVTSRTRAGLGARVEDAACDPGIVEGFGCGVGVDQVVRREGYGAVAVCGQSERGRMLLALGLRGVAGIAGTVRCRCLHG